MGLPIIRRQLQGAALDIGVHPVIERIYRGRNIRSPEDIDTTTSALCHYRQLKGIDKAAALLSDAIRQEKRVVIVGDFDADGATSTAVCMLALRQMGLNNVDYLVPNRFDFGYGLSEPLVEVAAQQGAELLVTVDNGIACHAGVTKAKTLGMGVIVTDHHLPGESLPQADAIVNPNQPDCEFPSKSLAGVGVAFYLMLACRATLIQQGWFAQKRLQPPNLAELLDIVAVGTVADVVCLDKNNRILVHQGLQRIRSGQCRPGIRALVEVANRQLTHLTASDLGFVVGPRLNAAGRLEDMALGIECLLCDDTMQARQMAAELDNLNVQRRTIETQMKTEAEKIIASLSIGDGDLPAALTVYNRDFHQGVIGIVAGRIKEKYQRPTIAFAHQDENILKGSARSIAGLHIRDLLDEINTTYPGVIDKFGGHAMAAGLSLPVQHLATFEQAFNSIVSRHLAKLDNHCNIVTDGELGEHELDLYLAQQLRQAGPFGQGFDVPLFDGIFALVDQRIVGQNHLKLVLRQQSGGEVDAIMFNTDTNLWPNPDVQRVQVAYRLEVNSFRNRESVQLLVEGMAPYEATR